MPWWSIHACRRGAAAYSGGAAVYLPLLLSAVAELRRTMPMRSAASVDRVGGDLWELGPGVRNAAIQYTGIGGGRRGYWVWKELIWSEKSS